MSIKVEKTETSETNILLKEILSSLKRIESLLLLNVPISDGNQLNSDDSNISYLDVMELINIVSEVDSNLIPTIKALLSKGGQLSAQEVAQFTNRSRSRENQHLNHLVELGYVEKKRDGREIIFHLRQNN